MDTRKKFPSPNIHCLHILILAHIGFPPSSSFKNQNVFWWSKIEQHMMEIAEEEWDKVTLKDIREHYRVVATLIPWVRSNDP